MIKAVFFDVDGTLVSHSRRNVPEDARLALKKLSETGIQRVLATGRHMIELSALPVHDISFDAYVTLNGQLCLDGCGNVIAENPITGTDKEHLLRLFQSCSIPIVLVEKERLYINFLNEYVEMAQQAVSSPLPEVGEYTGNEIYLAVAHIKKEDEQWLSAQLPGCAVTRWNDYGVDIVSASGGKVAGIKEYLKQTGIRREETMAFGDGENDMGMLEFVGIGVAMGNAEPCVKEIADHVTSSVDEGGILNALTAYGLIDPTKEDLT